MLIRQGCEISIEATNHYEELKHNVPNWNDVWELSAAQSMDSYTGFVCVDEDPSLLDGVPLDEVVGIALKHSEHRRNAFIESQPFIGFVKNHPEKALSALNLFGKSAEHPKALWESVIHNWPDDAAVETRDCSQNRSEHCRRTWF